MISNPPSFSIEVFDEFLVDWIVLNDQPFTEVESESFRKILTLLKPNLKIFGADNVRRRILGLFQSKQFEMKETFKDLDCKVSFTTDCWISPNLIAFMGVTAHYIDNDWNLQAHYRFQAFDWNSFWVCIAVHHVLNLGFQAGFCQFASCNQESTIFSIFCEILRASDWYK